MPLVTSSAIERIDYDWDNGSLRVTFRTGRTYRYAGVPPEVYDRFLAAESKGAFFSDRVRDRYPTELISDRRDYER